MEIKKLLLIAFWMIVSVSSMAQNGIIKGTIADANTKETLIGATIVIQGTTKEAISDFDGTAINVETKSVADENSLVISYSTKYVQHATFNNDFLTYSGGKTDWLGFDDGTRDIPNGVPSSNEYKELYNWQSVDDYFQKTEKLDQIAKLFSNNWETKSKNPLPHQSISATLQRRFLLGKFQ